MKKAILMDRDGTLIQEVGYLKMLEDLRFTTKATDALKLFHQLGFLNIVLTNQSAVARGILSPKELKKIHHSMKELAAAEDGVIDDIFVCPHYPGGRIAPYNIECDCRKPKPGLVWQARDKHQLDLRECILVGDKMTDLELAANADVRGVLVLTGYGAKTREEWSGPVEVYSNLFDLAKDIARASRPPELDMEQ